MIVRAEALLLRHPLARRRIFSTGSNLSRASVLIRAEDPDRRVGWGETYLVPGVWPDAQAIAAWLVGKDAEVLADELTRVRGAHRWLLGAVTTAVDDLRAQRAGVPLGQLYGPRVRDRVQAYGSSEGYIEGQPLLETWSYEAERVRAMGIRAFKLRVGLGPIADELPMVAAAQATAPDLAWMADVNGAWSARDVMEHEDAIEALGLRWLEEPLPTGAPAAYRPVQELLTVPVAGGESLETPGAAVAAMSQGAYDIIQPDAAICGGVAPVLRIGAAAAAAGVACVPHACNGAILLAATLQVLSVLPVQPASVEEGPLLEVDLSQNPIRSELLTQPVTFADGWVAIPAGPGLGVTVDEAVVARLRVA